MTSLIEFPIDLSRTASALESIAIHLSRAADALERLAPPIAHVESTRPATLSDLRRTDSNTTARVKEELQVFAENNRVMLDSDAFVHSIMEYEREVGEVYGEDAISELPWNKAAGGSLFQNRVHKAHAEARHAEARTEEQPRPEERKGAAD